jgi:hypothetical protein
MQVADFTNNLTLDLFRRMVIEKRRRISVDVRKSLWKNVLDDMSRRKLYPAACVKFWFDMADPDSAINRRSADRAIARGGDDVARSPL